MGVGDEQALLSQTEHRMPVYRAGWALENVWIYNVVQI
jgi:hypothetical protein